MQLQTAQDYLAAQEQQRAADSLALEDPTFSVAQSAGPTPKATSSDSPATPAVVARLTVPRFGDSWSRLVYEGTSINRVLTPLGVGHYSQSGKPGEIGNFALAAHRAGSGGPFRNIDKLRAGDLAYVEANGQRFTYRYLQSKIVEPSAIGVIAPKPLGLTAVTAAGSGAGAYLTLTSCTPIHVNTQRFVVWFELVATNDL